MTRPPNPVPEPHSGRVFATQRRVRLGDVSPKGRLRLDAVARYLQDIANDDAVDGAYSDIHGWVVRRTEMWVHRFPVYMDDVKLRTWCGGYGSHWAERRTQIASDAGALIETAALWVHVDLQTLRPTPLPSDFLPIVEQVSGGRRISAKLTIGKHLPPLSDDPSMVVPWPVRFTDMDAVGHLNNASYWIALEEYLSTHSSRRAPLHATVEHHLAIDPGNQVRIFTDEIDDRVVLRHVLDGGNVAAVTQLIAL
ncbi:MAG: acyl-[acyl-carrier-protein] thioesterase [Ilumatobacteraceae bacterium]